MYLRMIIPAAYFTFCGITLAKQHYIPNTQQGTKCESHSKTKTLALFASQHRLCGSGQILQDGSSYTKSLNTEGKNNNFE